jgi:DNA-binding HxlR family transcriptional regulator
MPLEQGALSSVRSVDMEPNVYSSACPSRRLLALLGDKWSLLILPALQNGAMRNGELMRMIDGISQKMLTQTLRQLERNGLVVRQDHGEVPPRVEYTLSPLGRSLAGVFAEIDGWVHDHYSAVEAAQAAFDRREEAVWRDRTD